MSCSRGTRHALLKFQRGRLALLVQLVHQLLRYAHVCPGHRLSFRHDESLEVLIHPCCRANRRHSGGKSNRDLFRRDGRVQGASSCSAHRARVYDRVLRQTPTVRPPDRHGQRRRGLHPPLARRREPSYRYWTLSSPSFSLIDMLYRVFRRVRGTRVFRDPRLPDSLWRRRLDAE